MVRISADNNVVNTALENPHCPADVVDAVLAVEYPTNRQHRQQRFAVASPKADPILLGRVMLANAYNMIGEYA